MTVDELLKKLGINAEYTITKQGSYVIDIENSDEYGKYYSILDKNGDLIPLGDTVQMTLNNSNIEWLIENYKVTLQSDWIGDTYKMIITPLDVKTANKLASDASGDEDDEEEIEDGEKEED